MADTLTAQESLNDSDTFLYYDKLHFIPVEQKDKEWCARVLLFNKYHSEPFQDPAKAAIVRSRAHGTVDVAMHKKRIDPENGEAKFFSSDWKACPIDQHLDEIVETTVKQIPINLSVKAADEYSISAKERM